MIYTLLKNEEFNYAKIRSFMRNKWTKEELDFIKNNCKNTGINLIRIPYWEFKNIDLILKEKLA